MPVSPELSGRYAAILNAELVPAMGCTEPISIAYAAAKAREVLGCAPERAELIVSNNIIKNVKSVVVPNTGGLKGLEAAVAAAPRPEMPPAYWRSSAAWTTRGGAPLRNS